jgi:hypothetical protein
MAMGMDDFGGGGAAVDLLVCPPFLTSHESDPKPTAYIGIDFGTT